jgi:hypothetical protein
MAAPSACSAGSATSSFTSNTFPRTTRNSMESEAVSGTAYNNGGTVSALSAGSTRRSPPAAAANAFVDTVRMPIHKNSFLMADNLGTGSCACAARDIRRRYGGTNHRGAGTASRELRESQFSHVVRSEVRARCRRRCPFPVLGVRKHRLMSTVERIFLLHKHTLSQ